MYNKHMLSVIACFMLFTTAFTQITNDFFVDVDPLEDELLSLLQDPEDWDMTIRMGIDKYTPQDVLDVIAEPPINAQDVLLENIYFFTNPPNRRSLHDSPQYYFNHSCPCNWQIMIQPFYNLTHKVNFTQNSTVLKDYADLQNPNILQRIDDLEFDDDIPRVLSLFFNTKLQEHRIGFMFGGLKNNGDWFYEFRIPMYYALRNFYLSKDEQDAIKNEPFFADINSNVDKFIKQHLISDRVGFGTTRMYLGKALIDNECFYLAGGGLTTLPTSYAFGKGLYGSTFNKQAPQPPFDFLTLFNLALSQDCQNQPLAIEMVEDFFIGALDRLTSILAEDDLGNGGHLGLGVFLDNEITYNPCLTLRTHIELEYLLPAKETRFYLEKKIPADFLDRDYTNPAMADQNLQFLNDQVVNTFYPRGIQTHVFPGFIFKWATGIDYHAEKYSIMFGNDLYWKQKESLGNINTTQALREMLRKNIAHKTSAFQNKLFASGHYYHDGTDVDWNIGLYVDASFFNYGLGDSYNLAIRFETNL